MVVTVVSVVAVVVVVVVHINMAANFEGLPYEIQTSRFEMDEKEGVYCEVSPVAMLFT